MPLSIGGKLGPYEILARIGAGGMGEVYKARDTRLGRMVAIKVLPEHIAKREDRRALFEREARAIASLKHPNICTLHDIGQQDGAGFMVMELMEGETLGQRLQKGALPLDEALEFAMQIGDAVDCAHRAGVIHGDLKPQNIMLTREGAKVLDFGLAKSRPEPAPSEETVTASLTAKGTIIGTPQYMAPEQFAGKEADARSDIWGFGAVLYEMVTGQRAFQGKSYPSLVGAILSADPAPMLVKPLTPAWLERLVRRCLAKNPEDRWQSMRDVVLELRSPMMAGPARPLKPAYWLWAVAAVMLVAGTLIGWEVKSSREPQKQEYRFQLNPPEGSQFDPGRGLALSPDGRSLSFFASGPRNIGLWVRAFDGTTARLLPGTEAAFGPFWSPDSHSIAYWASGKLWRVDVRGGAPTAICDESFFLGGEWAPDGNIVFGAGTSGLRRVPASGGTPEPLTTPDASRGETAHLYPQLLPGGRILFIVVGKPGQAGIYATSFRDPRERIQLVANSGNGLYAAEHLLWLRGSTLVAQRFDPEGLKLSGEPKTITDPVGADGFTRMLAAVSGSVLVHGRSGGWQLTWLDRAGQAAHTENRILGPPGGSSTFRISPDGRRVAVSRGSESESDMWMVEVERDAWSRFTFLRRPVGIPIWSPDGRQLMFSAGSPENLYRKEASGAGTEQRVTESANPRWPADWSRDGRLVLYTELAPDTQGDLWVLPVTPDGKPEAGVKARPYLRTRSNEWGGRFSPEPSPHWVAYASDESGRFEVYVQAFPEPRGKFQISTVGGTYPEWSPDGRELYYVAPDRKLMAVDLRVRADSLATSPPRELVALPPGVGEIIQPYAVTPDGKRFLVQALAGGSQPLEVVVNWPALLKQGATRE